MMSLCRVGAPLLVALAVHGSRAGDEDASSANSTKWSDNADAELKDWFKNNKLPSGDIEKMDGSVDDPIWAYMKSDCFQSRYRKATEHLMKHKCETVIEVGGYLTPLSKYILEQKDKGGHMPKKYMNIDPSMKNAAAEKTDGLEIFHLPMTVADFFDSATEPIRKKFGLKADKSNTCSLMFGIWDPHFKEDQDKTAIVKLVKKSLWMGAEASLFAKSFVFLTGKICEKKGMTLESEYTVDCRGTEGNEDKSDVSVTRLMKLYERKKGGKETKGSLIETTDSTENEEESDASDE